MEDDKSDPRDDTKGQKHGKTPEEVKESVKQGVAKGVAAVAGALKGFTEEAKKHDLAGTTKDAIQKAGETTRQVAGTAKQEIHKTKAHLQGGRGSSGVTGDSGPQMGMGGAALDADSTTRPNKMDDLPDLRKTELSKSDEELENE